MLLPVHSSNLQQLHINSNDLELPDEFMRALSAHGRLVHVLLNVRTVSIEGITVLVENSPDLLILHINGIPFEEHLVVSLKEKFCHRKLFTRGSFKSLDIDIEHNTNLLSLWSEAFLTDVRIDDISSDNDNLSVASLDDFQTDPFAGFDDLEEYQISNIM